MHYISYVKNYILYIYAINNGESYLHRLPKKCTPWEINGVHQELKPTLSQMLVYDINARLSSSSVTTSLVSGPSADTG